jgi:hypothetical protein
MPGPNVDLKQKPPAATPDIHLTKATKKSNLIREFPLGNRVCTFIGFID